MTLLDKIREHFLAKDSSLSKWEAEEKAVKVIDAVGVREDRAFAMVNWIYA